MGEGDREFHVQPHHAQLIGKGKFVEQAVQPVASIVHQTRERKASRGDGTAYTVEGIGCQQVEFQHEGAIAVQSPNASANMIQRWKAARHQQHGEPRTGQLMGYGSAQPLAGTSDHCQAFIRGGHFTKCWKRW